MDGSLCGVGFGYRVDLCLLWTVFQVHLHRLLVMTKRPLIPVMLTAVLVLAALNVMMIALSHRLPYRIKLEAIRTARDPNLLFVGNSLLDHHLDAGAFAEAASERGVHFDPLNSALGASDPPEQRLLFHYAVAKHPGISTLVVGFFDFQLTAADHSRIADLRGNRMVGLDRRFPADEVAAAYDFGPMDRAELTLLRAFPMAANRASAWKDVELLRRSMASIGMPAVATNSMGRVDDFAALEASSPQNFDAQASAFLADRGHFNASYEAIFAQARQANMMVAIVVMPMSPYHWEISYGRPIWGEYLKAIEALSAERGIRVIDASQWLPAQTDFVDHLHMTQEASRRFSLRLGRELPQALVQ
jgi:hypothetical protein